MTYTEKLNLALQGRKPERVSLDALNGNFSTIDETVGGDSENTALHFAENEKTQMQSSITQATAHVADTDIHVTAAEKEAWNALIARVTALENGSTSNE